MADLSAAHSAALTEMLRRCPDAMLAKLGAAVSEMPGPRAEALAAMIQMEALDRKRRARVLGPLFPMFLPRPDGVEALTFPPAVLARLWEAASAREAALLPTLDRGGGRGLTVSDRLCVAAAAVARDAPDTLWPSDGKPNPKRDQALAELAGCCDLAALARRGLPSLAAWIGRPSEDQVAELRLLLRDATAVSPDAAQRLLEIFFAHLGDAAPMLRLVALSSSAAGNEAFLFESELAVFVDRLIRAVEDRVTRIAAFKPALGGDPVATLEHDIAWCAAVLEELDVTLQLRPGSAWGKQAYDARARINRKLLGLLRSAEKTVRPALPTVEVKLSGRMMRSVPKLDQPVAAEAIDAARMMLALLGAMRGASTVFGCESERQQLVQSLTERLATYADLTLEVLNAGEAPDDAEAFKAIDRTAAFLMLIDARDEARTVKRRAAVAGRPAAAGTSRQRA